MEIAKIAEHQNIFDVLHSTSYPSLDNEKMRGLKALQQVSFDEQIPDNLHDGRSRTSGDQLQDSHFRARRLKKVRVAKLRLMILLSATVNRRIYFSSVELRFSF